MASVSPRDRFHNTGHGGYFEGDFPQTYWKPWIHSGEWVESGDKAGETPFPGWLGARGLNWIGFSAVAVLLLALMYLVLGLPLCCGRERGGMSISYRQVWQGWASASSRIGSIAGDGWSSWHGSPWSSA